jgi:hypothetical protein
VPSTLVKAEWGAFAAGMFMKAALPMSSTARQKVTDGHEILSREPAGSTRLTVHRLSGRSGVRVVSTSPLASAATHSDSDGRDTLVMSLGPSPLSTTFVSVQAETRAGFADARTFPSSSTATHNEGERDDTLVNVAGMHISPPSCIRAACDQSTARTPTTAKPMPGRRR